MQRMLISTNASPTFLAEPNATISKTNLKFEKTFN